MFADATAFVYVYRQRRYFHSCRHRLRSGIADTLGQYLWTEEDGEPINLRSLTDLTARISSRSDRTSRPSQKELVHHLPILQMMTLYRPSSFDGPY